MTIRRATEADEQVLRELWEEFEAEIPDPPGFAPMPWEEEWDGIRNDMRDGSVFIAEDDEGPVGLVRAGAPKRGRAHIDLVHVRPRARRQGITRALLRATAADARERGAHLVSLDVLGSNEIALKVWRRLGFEEISKFMSTPLEALDARLADTENGEHRGTTHVQTDDELSVERALAQFLPRLEQPDVRTSRQGWIRITDSLTDRDRDAHGRLARELSERLGAVTIALALEGAVVRFRLYERGRMVDEYLSVPNHYGELPKGDELALAANPTLVARLTGADREQVRAVARTADSPADLPPAPELYDELARLMGVEP